MDTITGITSKRLRAAREAAGLTQAELGDSLGISGNAITKIEAGRSTLTLPHLVELPKILHQPITYFLGLENPAGLTDDEAELLELYRAVEEPRFRRYVLTFIRDWIEGEADEED